MEDLIKRVPTEIDKKGKKRVMLSVDWLIELIGEIELGSFNIDGREYQRPHLREILEFAYTFYIKTAKKTAKFFIKLTTGSVFFNSIDSAFIIYDTNSRLWHHCPQAGVTLMLEDAIHGCLSPVIEKLLERAENMLASDARREVRKLAKEYLSLEKLMASFKGATETTKFIIYLFEKYQKYGKIILPAFDADPYLLSVAGGSMVDLRTGDSRPRVKEDYCTRSTSAEYFPEANLSLIEPLINPIFPDPENRQFAQIVLGYLLLGENIYERVFVFIGAGSNGKSKLLSYLLDVLGDYCAIADRKSLKKIKNERTSGHSMSLCTSNGARVAILSGDNLIKNFSGRDKLSIPGIFARKRTTRERVTNLVNCCNQLHNISRDWISSRGLTILPFDCQFVTNPTLPHHHPSDIHILNKLRTPACMNAFLHFLIQGCIRAINSPDTFNTLPPEVVEVNEDSRNENDTIDPFLENIPAKVLAVNENNTIDSFLRTLPRDGRWPARVFYDNYKEACRNVTHSCKSIEDFSQYCRNEGGMIRRRSKIGNYYMFRA